MRRGNLVFRTPGGNRAAPGAGHQDARPSARKALSTAEHMRIAVVTSQRKIVGGAETYLRWLLPELRRRGHELLLVHEYGGDAVQTIDANVTDLRRVDLAAASPAAVLGALRDFAPDVAFLHAMESAPVEREIALSAPSVLFAHAYYGTCATGQKRFALPSVRTCERTLGPACLGLNYLRGCGFRSPTGLARTYQVQRARLEIVRFVRTVVVASTHMRREYERHGVAEGSLVTLPYPTLDVRPDPEPPSARAFSNQLLFLGRLTALKGCEDAILALPRVRAQLGRDVRLFIGGTGPDEAKLKRLAAATEPNAVHFLGWVDHGEKIQLMRQADALIVPSSWPEPFGIVGPEAGCVGLPAVGYAVGGITDWLTPGVTGEAAALEGGPVALADAMVRALTSSSRWQTLREGAWKMAQRFDPERHLNQLESVLQRAAGTAPDPATTPALRAAPPERAV